MRKLILIFLLSTFVASAQTVLNPEPALFSYRNWYNTFDTTGILLERYFPFNHILTGWQWGQHPRITQEITSNMYQTTTSLPTNVFQDLPNFVPTNKINTIVGISNSFPMLAQSFLYEPTLYIPHDSIGTFRTRANDPSNPIFGFSFVRGRIESFSSDPTNFSRLIFDSASQVNQVVLSNPWPSTQLHCNYDKDDNPNHQYMNGQNWYLSINLRRLDSNDNSSGNLNILEIKLPYKLGNNTAGNIVFELIPDVNNLQDINYNGNRGKAFGLQTAQPYCTTLVITKDMLPYNNSCHDYTLSAHFKCNGPNGTNPYLSTNRSHATDNDKIDSLKIEVRYLSNACSVAVDWIKLESDWAYNVLRGAQDNNAYQTKLAFKDANQQLIDNLETSNTYKYFRLYGQSGDDGLVLWNWGILRYLNKFYNGFVTASIPAEYPKHYFHYIGSLEKWTPSPNVKAFSGWMSSPYYKAAFKTNNLDTTYGFHYYGGYLTNENYWPNSSCATCIRADTLNSSWETYSTRLNSSLALQITDTTFLSDLRNLSTSEYLHHLNDHMHSLQAKWEYFIYINNIENNYFLYSEQPWWAQLFVVSNWGLRKLDDNNNLNYFNRVYNKYGYTKPKTGEETRLQCWMALINGAKGLIYDRQFSYDILPVNPENATTESMFAGCGITDNGVNSVNVDAIPADTTGLDFLRSPRLGGDFLTEKEATNLPLYMDTSLLKQYLNVPDGRIYMGRLSQRLELKKIHETVKATESALMRLRLACWLGKGFKTWYNQDTARFGSNNLLTQFIDTSRTRLFTKKLFSVNPSTMEYVPQISPEGYDSMFTDITILRDTSNNEMDKYFILGIQNRRTDPLVLWEWDSLGTKKHYMRFLSTAEFEDFCHTGADTLKFQDLYWKQLGCRELHIPFKFRNSNKSNDWTTLRVTELGYGDTALNKQTWRQKPYYHLIDTLINRDSTLIVRLLPGEGKMLKVSIAYTNYPDTLRGELAYSNQRKLVAYPIHQTADNQYGDPDTVIYHAVYHKKIGATNRYGVYYRRSQKMLRDYPVNIINWMPEKLISDTVYYDTPMGPYRDTCMDCRYPSIVVRYDEGNDTTKAYIVYRCSHYDKPIGYGFPLKVVESQIPVNLTGLISNEGGKTISIVHGDTSLPYGVPVINGSRSGNYYAFADQLYGIVAGWKRPDSLYFTLPLDTIHIRWNQESNPISLMPSLNTYSKIRLGQEDCALVWQESQTPEGDKDVYFTRLKDTTAFGISFIRKYLAPNFISTPNFYPEIILNSDSSIIKISETNLSSSTDTYPTVFQSLEDHIFSENGRESDSISTLETHYDRIYWNTNDYFNYSPEKQIAWRTIGITDLNSKEKDILIDATSWLLSPDKNLDLVNASQGNLVKQNYDSAIVINFVEYPLDSTINRYAKVIQINQSYWTFFEYDNDTLSENETVNFESSQGLFPHLAALPYLYKHSDWNYGRRIFEYGEANPPVIVSSLNKFYRINESEHSCYPFLGYMSRNGNQFITAFYVSDKEGRNKRLNMFTHKRENGKIVPRDTIVSQWFTASDISSLKFFEQIRNTRTLNISIQRERDRRTTNLPMEAFERGFARHNYRLINGSNNRFRFVITRNGSQSYHEMLVLNGLPDVVDDSRIDSSRFGRTVYEHQEQIIDLGDERQENSIDKISISIYPNPADELVYTTAYMPYSDVVKYNKMTIKVFSNLGLELYRQDVKSGETITINTKNYPQGAYFIRAEEQSDRFFTEKQSAAVQGFVIRR